MTRAIAVSIAAFFLFIQEAATFEIRNQCPYKVWAAASPGGGKELAQEQSWSIQVPSGTTMGRVWGRTGCSFDVNGRGTCQTGDCNGLLNCQGYGQVPATLAEFALNRYQNLDFYDISLIRGFNLPLSMTSNCNRIACLSDINSKCPNDLKVGGGCIDGCSRYNTPQDCCTGAYAEDKCQPTSSSKFFKGECMQAYSYPKDDQTSTFTCAGGGNYKVVFCG